MPTNGSEPGLAGLLLLDKPAGLSSNQALQKVRRALRVERAGHAGTLDPLATGMLPIALGEATKLCGYMLEADKAYAVRARLGVRTDTLDADGTVCAVQAVPADWASGLDAALAPLTGAILQVPPQFSALKRGGRPAYELARAGIAVELPARPVRIERIEVQARGPDWLDLEVHCGKGTYIRTLVDDLGLALGCGAHVERLRRLWVAPFAGHSMVAFEQVLADPAAASAAILPVQAMVPQLPTLEVTAAVAARLRLGQRVAGFTAQAAQPALLLIESGSLLGIAELDAHGVLRPSRLLHPARLR